MQNNCPSDSSCPVDFAFKRIGGKYKGRILWYLAVNKVMRYGEIKRTLPDITTKMLTQTLRELELDTLISRRVYLEVPPRVEYALTNVGKELTPLIEHLRDWGQRQMDRTTSETRVKSRKVTAKI